MNQQDDAVRHWLLTWQDLIALGDFNAASRLVEAQAVGFGTVAVRADGPALRGVHTHFSVNLVPERFLAA